MTVPHFRLTPRRVRRLLRSSSAALFAAACFTPSLGAAANGSTAATDDDDSRADPVALSAYNVKADRLEDFGLRVGDAPITFVAFVPMPEAPYINAVLPNTAAAKAGLQPGDRILKSDGRSAAMTVFSHGKWRKNLAAKNAQAAAGKAVTWTLEIKPRGKKETRVVTLTLPSPPPHWGAAVWQAPQGRLPATVPEPGPLAERSRGILDHGIATSVDAQFLDQRGSSPPEWPFSLGYSWHIGDEHSALHRMIVTQVTGRTEVLFESRSPATGCWVYRTSPTGVLEKAWHFTRKKKGEVPLDQARLGFAHELDLWTSRVGKVSARWPFELKPGYDPNTIFATLAAADGSSAATRARPVAADLLKLAPANEAERSLFTDAYAKLGADPDGWAYTETSRGLENQRVTSVRVDPSKPEEERCVLLSIDGKPPTQDEVQRWRDEEGDTPKALGTMPPLASIVDLQDLRVHAQDASRIVFELPIRTDSAQFPAEKFQALFRVNRAQRALEEITIRLRDSFRVAGVVKVTEGGLQARFQTLDPTQPPQLVFLKGGGAARIFLLRIGRDFETTRTDFRRIEIPEPNAGR